MQALVETDYSRWGRVARLTPEEFLARDHLADGLLLIDYGAVELPLLIRQRGAPATFYGFHAAMHPEVRRALPFFQGRQIAPKRLNMVLVGDPSLYLHPEVKVGWFLGNRHCLLTEELPVIMDHLDRLMGARRRLLWGNSAGGTAALRYARDQDVAVAINPQIILERFTWGRVLPWLRHGWEAHGKEAQRAFAAEHGDLRRDPPRGRIVYVQNTTDDHLPRHMRALAEVMDLPVTHGEHARHRVVLGDWGKGHIPPQAPIQRRLLEEEAGRLLCALPAMRAGRRAIRVGNLLRALSDSFTAQRQKAARPHPSKR